MVWTHSVNTPSDLESAIFDGTHIIAADVMIGTSKFVIQYYLLSRQGSHELASEEVNLRMVWIQG